ncbi:hypothetical protein D3C78_1695530 [compost metagenome]
MRDNGLGGSFVDFAGSSRGDRCRGAGGRRWRLRRGGLVFAFAATGEGNSDGQQTGGGQGHTNHGEHPASVMDGTGARVRKNCDIMRKICIMCKGLQV